MSGNGRHTGQTQKHAENFTPYRISISFTPDSNNSNGTLYINGVTGYDSDAGTFDSLILEIKAETDLAATSGGDFG